MTCTPWQQRKDADLRSALAAARAQTEATTQEADQRHGALRRDPGGCLLRIPLGGPAWLGCGDPRYKLKGGVLLRPAKMAHSFEAVVNGKDVLLSV